MNLDTTKISLRQALHECHYQKAFDIGFQHLSKMQGDFELYLLCAISARSIGQSDKAEVCAREALKLLPGHQAALSILGDILISKKEPDQALEFLRLAVRRGGETAGNYLNIGLAYQLKNSYEKSVVYFNRALQLNQELLSALINRGLAEFALKDFKTAEETFNAALKICPDNPEVLWNKSHLLLTKGRYLEGFKLFESRHEHSELGLKRPTYAKPFWDGKLSLNGKTLLVYSEGGFGDTIQFFRYLRLFDKKTRVLLHCQNPLISLFQRSVDDNVRVFSKGDLLPHYDYVLPIMSLPTVFKTSLKTVPKFDRYVYASNGKVQKWLEILGSKKKPRIAIAWRGSKGHVNDKNRSLSLGKILPHLSEEIEWISLQKDLPSDESAVISRLKPLRDISQYIENFDDTAAVCDLVDQVVTVDTAVGHLSGALGQRVHLMLPYSSDWRWGHSAKTSQWYKNHVLYRQQAWDDWDSVLNNVFSGLLNSKVADKGRSTSTKSLREEVSK